jgi:hypothetical protein
LCVDDFAGRAGRGRGNVAEIRAQLEACELPGLPVEPRREAQLGVAPAAREAVNVQAPSVGLYPAEAYEDAPEAEPAVVVAADAAAVVEGAVQPDVDEQAGAAQAPPTSLSKHSIEQQAAAVSSAE